MAVCDESEIFALLWLRLDDDKRLVVYCFGDWNVVECLVADLVGGRLCCLAVASMYTGEIDYHNDRYVFVAIVLSE